MNPAFAVGICVFLCGQLRIASESAGDSVDLKPIIAVRQLFHSDPWFGEDKFMHFYASAGICGSSFYLLERRFGRDAGESALYSVSVTGLIGLGKETYDQIRGGHFSVKDLVWDAAGIAAGYFILVHQY